MLPTEDMLLVPTRSYAISRGFRVNVRISVRIRFRCQGYFLG